MGTSHQNLIWNDLSRDTPLGNIWGTQIYARNVPNTPNIAKYGIWCKHLAELNMVEWGVQEKIMQNALQARR